MVYNDITTKKKQITLPIFWLLMWQKVFKHIICLIFHFLSHVESKITGNLRTV